MTIAAFEHVSEERYRLDAPEGAMPVEAIPLPRRGTAGSAGYDFVSPVSFSLQPGEFFTVPTGIRARMEPGWVLLLMPRSSLGFRYGLRLANTVGVIDSDYYGAANEGHIQVRLTCDRPVEIRAGDRFCQGLFVPYGLAEEDDRPALRTGGLGSTGQ